MKYKGLCYMRDHVSSQLSAHLKLLGGLQVVPISLHSVHHICCVFPYFNSSWFWCPGSITSRCSVTFPRGFLKCLCAFVTFV